MGSVTPHEQADAPLVSICITACNRAQYVVQSIDSALAQTYPNLEFVIVDDASDDGTFEILARYIDPRIRLVRNPKRLGQAANRNRAIRLARGDLIKFLDDDDMLDPQCVAEMAAVFARDNRVGFAFCRRRVLVAEEVPGFTERYTTPHFGFGDLSTVTDGRELLHKWIESGIRQNWIGEPSAVMVRRSVLARSSGFNTRVNRTDLDLWVRLLLYAHVVCVDSELVSYRVGHESVARGNYETNRSWLDRLWILENLSREIQPAECSQLGEQLRAERRAVLRTVAKLGRAPDGRRLPVAPYRHYLAFRGASVLGRRSRASACAADSTEA